jgi:hypothetical protein
MGNKGVTLGADDTIYVGSEPAITAINPDGTLRWRFIQDQRAFFLLGPNVGPDGNIYAVAVDALGVFSLTPDGNLRWSVPEAYQRPPIDLEEIVFGPGGPDFLLYFQANGHFQGRLLLDGGITFSLGGSPSDPYADPQLAVGPDGTIYRNSSDYRQSAYDASGNILWTFQEGVTGGLLMAPDLGPDNIIYLGRNGDLYAVNPDGTERWHYRPDSGILFGPTGPAVSPNNDLIFLSGLFPGWPFFFEGVSTAGAQLWRIVLPSEGGRFISASSRARFANDGQTVYVGTNVSGQQHGDEQTHSYLYAVQTVR